MSSKNLRKTPLHSLYSQRSGVKLIDFGGWEMPVQFSRGILAEYWAVRTDTGLFDISHMGEIVVQGPDVEAFLDNLVTNKVGGGEPGRCLYTPMCREDGGTIDDLLIYVLENETYLLVVNAGNTEKDFLWITTQIQKGDWNVQASNLSSQWAQLALQGPRSVQLLSPHAKGFDPQSIGYYQHAGIVEVAGIQTLVSRTGYTGEDGFELYCAPEDAPGLWGVLEDAGAVPCGLGARDLLRLETRFPLYGHELTEDICPLEAGLGIFVKLDKEEFVGRQAILAMKDRGSPRRLYGLEMVDPGVPREGYSVFPPGDQRLLGHITSGGRSPIREGFIALALLERGSISINDEVEVDIRGKLRRARVVKTPFYRRS